MTSHKADRKAALEPGRMVHLDIESYPPEIVKKIREYGVEVETFAQIVRSETGGIYPMRVEDDDEMRELFKAPIDQPYIWQSTWDDRRYRRWFNNLSLTRKNYYRHVLWMSQMPLTTEHSHP